MRILLVEDNPLDADLIGRALAECPGCQRPIWAGTLAQAREQLARPGDFDVVLTDLALADGTGFELLREIRARDLPLAVVVLTGQGDEQVVLAALKAGADDYLAKASDYAGRLPATLTAALARFQADRTRLARPMRVLYAESSSVDAELMRRHLDRQAPHISLTVVGSAAQALQQLPRSAREPASFDVLLLDYRLPGESGLDLLKQVREERGLDLPVVIVTGQGGEEVAAQAMRLGASDYLVKHAGYLNELALALENAFHRTAAAREHERLAQSQERLSLVLRGSNDGPWDIDIERGLSYLSPRFWQMLGHPDNAAVFDEDLQRRLFHPDEYTAMRQHFQEILRSRAESFEMEARLLHADGHYVPVLARGFVVRDAQGRALRIAGTNTDLTERKRAEDAIRELNASLERRVAERTRELELANRELEAFAYSVSHDLRAPLRAIDGLSAMLEREVAGALSSDGVRLVRQLRDSANRMDTLINDLLRFARTSRESLMRVQTPVAALVRLCLSELSSEIETRRIALEIGELPPCQADPNLLRQVFANLLGNAVKYTRKQEQPRIEVGWHRLGPQPAYFVRDNGAGFDMKYADKLFGVFQRLHSTREFEGTGVGLAIAARIVERHGGRIWAEAAPRQGATFYFSIGEPATVTADPAR